MLLLWTLVTGTLLGDVRADAVMNMTDARNYMNKYFLGPSYHNSMFGQLQTEQEMHNVLKEFQHFFGLNMTGELDAATTEMMGRSRCGRPDMISVVSDVKRRRKRYALQGSRWPTNSPISWKITRYTSSDLTDIQVDAIMTSAFQIWSDAAVVDFRQIASTSSEFPDIEIFFASGSHGDGSAFDGPGRTLAHAYFPQFGGDGHYDDDELWTDQTFSGTNLLQVAIHEIGHSLGLEHSGVDGSIMFPTYNGFVPGVTLHSDDISGIQAIYGARDATPAPTPATPAPTPATPTPTPATPAPTPAPTPATPAPGTPAPGTPAPTPATPAPTPSPTPNPPPPNSLRQRFCQNLRFDATSTFGGRTYAFKGDLYSVLTPQGAIAPGYPRLIADDWQGAPSNLDAALHWKENSPPRIYLFKDSQYWRYELDSNGRPQLRSGYPRSISNGFRGLADNIDNAFVWGRNGKTYIMKGDGYYRLYRNSRNQTRGLVDNGYPKPSSIWGLPETRYDSILQWTNGRTYLFANNQYIRLNDRYLGVDNSNPPYPRPIDGWWTDCQTAGLHNDMGSELEDRGFLIVSQANDNDGTTRPTPRSESTRPTPRSEDDDTGVATNVHQGALVILFVMAASLVI